MAKASITHDSKPVPIERSTLPSLSEDMSMKDLMIALGQVDRIVWREDQDGELINPEPDAEALRDEIKDRITAEIRKPESGSDGALIAAYYIWLNNECPGSTGWRDFEDFYAGPNLDAIVNGTWPVPHPSKKEILSIRELLRQMARYDRLAVELSTGIDECPMMRECLRIRENFTIEIFDRTPETADDYRCLLVAVASEWEGTLEAVREKVHAFHPGENWERLDELIGTEADSERHVHGQA